MPDATISSRDEVCQALVDWINAPDQAYTLPSPATYTWLAMEDLPDVTSLQVLITHISSKQAGEVLDPEDDPSTHRLIVWVIDKLPNASNEEVASRNLVFEQIYQRVNRYRMPGNRVMVRQCGYDDVENPDKDLIRSQLLFKAGLIVIADCKAPE